ncbi:MAG: SPFH domain-containing protein [Spirochaetia bacterium]|jgi:regulator of protease activity HflC (stomatin/prohibitin superfamily)|nr:SPFH domain-containing protein [Spirochaetia bacterium]
MPEKNEVQTSAYEEERPVANPHNGIAFLLANSLIIILGILGFIIAVGSWDFYISISLRIFLGTISGAYSFVIGPLLYMGLKTVKPNEAIVLTLFGKYYGTLKKEGLYFVNPFATAFNPASNTEPTTADPQPTKSRRNGSGAYVPSKKISLKAMTLNNQKQTINDALGNPIIIGVVVIWKVIDTAKAVFNVDNYVEFLSIQCDSALRNVVRKYPYDAAEGEDELSLRGSSQEVAEKLTQELQEKVNIAGLQIIEARITHLSYAPEIAAVMLQRQQASAIIAARQKIVEGAVSMVEMALNQLSENHIVELDDERKAAMVSNLLVVLCGNKDAQPVVNSGSIY